MEFREGERTESLCFHWLSGTYQILVEIPWGFCAFDIGLWLITGANERQKILN